MYSNFICTHTHTEGEGERENFFFCLYCQLLREVCWNLPPWLWICLILLVVFSMFAFMFWGYVIKNINVLHFYISWWIEPFICMKIPFSSLVMIFTLNFVLSVIILSFHALYHFPFIFDMVIPYCVVSFQCFWEAVIHNAKTIQWGKNGLFNKWCWKS